MFVKSWQEAGDLVACCAGAEENADMHTKGRTTFMAVEYLTLCIAGRCSIMYWSPSL